MKTRIELEILPQPDDETCGATCLQAVYKYWGDDISLDEVIDGVQHLETGGTLGALLGAHALGRNYSSLIYTYNLRVFDPTWFRTGVDVGERLKKRRALRSEVGMRAAIDGYLGYLDAGGEVKLEDLTAELLVGYLDREVPLITGLSSTFLYRSMREVGPDDDDVSGDPSGHFVVLCGYDRAAGTVLVADPYRANPLGADSYEVTLDRMVASILLGIVTHDANVVVIEPNGR